MNVSHTVPLLEEPIRLQEYGVGIFLQTQSKSALKKILKKERIKVNGKIATTATFINGGEHIELIAEVQKTNQKLVNFSLEILYEDDFLACIYKPAGILVSGNKHKTIYNALPENLKESQHPDACRAKPVHRLDFATSGLLLVGKTNAAIRQLNILFETRKIQKQYVAVVTGTLPAQGEITTSIEGKEAQSSYVLLEQTDAIKFGTLNLLKLDPTTGRRHQLRKHLKDIGHPILGDVLYGEDQQKIKGKGLFLHAFSLRFEHPFSGKEMLIKAPLPRKFTQLFPKASCV